MPILGRGHNISWKVFKTALSHLGNCNMSGLLCTDWATFSGPGYCLVFQELCGKSMVTFLFHTQRSYCGMQIVPLGYWIKIPRNLFVFLIFHLPLQLKTVSKAHDPILYKQKTICSIVTIRDTAYQTFILGTRTSKDDLMRCVGL